MDSSVGYVQGMSDIAGGLLSVFGSEMESLSPKYSKYETTASGGGGGAGGEGSGSASRKLHNDEIEYNENREQEERVVEAQTYFAFLKAMSVAVSLLLLSFCSSSSSHCLVFLVFNIRASLWGRHQKEGRGGNG